MDITLQDVKECVARFGIHDNIQSIELLADGPDHYVPYDVIRKIILIKYETNVPMVIKFVREEIFSPETINNQCSFSDFLGEIGITVPKRWKADYSYCIKFEKDGLDMDVYIESYFSTPLQTLSLDTINDVGKIMGKMHSASIKHNKRIGFSMLYNEVLYKDTSYERLWRGEDHSFIDKKSMEDLLSVYNSRLNIIKGIWSDLPRAAVQGDIYSHNNFALENGRLAIFDFNLAGDEAVLGDCMLYWFRTIFDEKIQDEIAQLNIKDMWENYWKGYSQYRKLTEIEIKHLPDVYAILGCLYYTKLLAFKVSTGRSEEAKKTWRFLFELLNVDKKILPKKFMI